MGTIWRGLKGAMVGAGFVGAIGVLMIGLPTGLLLLLDIDKPIDRANDLDHMRKGLVLLLPVVLVGGIAGLAARLPQRSVGMLKSIAIVGGCAILARLPTAIQPRFIGSPEPSYIPVILAALLGGVVVFVYGVVVSRRSTTNVDSETVKTDQPHDPPSEVQADG